MTQRTKVRLRGLAADDRAAVAVESAFVLPILFVVILACIQFGLTMFGQAILDNATYVASRQIMIGTIQQSGGGQSAFTSDLCAQLQVLSCSGVQVDVQSSSSFASLTAATQGGNGQLSSTGFSPGGPGSDVLVQVAYSQPCIVPIACNFLNPNGDVLLISTVSFENENY